jgi:hypothetical protein
MIRFGNYKYVSHPNNEGELYDLEKDPGELENLFGLAGYGETVRVLKEKIGKYTTYYILER